MTTNYHMNDVQIHIITILKNAALSNNRPKRNKNHVFLYLILTCPKTYELYASFKLNVRDSGASAWIQKILLNLMPTALSLIRCNNSKYSFGSIKFVYIFVELVFVIPKFKPVFRLETRPFFFIQNFSLWI